MFSFNFVDFSNLESMCNFLLFLGLYYSTNLLKIAIIFNIGIFCYFISLFNSILQLFVTTVFYTLLVCHLDLGSNIWMLLEVLKVKPISFKTSFEAFGGEKLLRAHSCLGDLDVYLLCR